MSIHRKAKPDTHTQQLQPHASVGFTLSTGHLLAIELGSEEGYQHFLVDHESVLPLLSQQLDHGEVGFEPRADGQPRLPVVGGPGHEE